MSATADRIVTATTELLRRHGYRGTALAAVSAAAAAPTGSVYHHFPGGKDELVARAITRSGATYEELFEAIADEAPDGAGAIAAFFDGAATALEETDYVDLCPIGTVAAEVASTHDDLRRAADAVFASWIATLTRRLEADGLSPRHAADVAVTAVAALQGAFVLARSARDATALRTAGRLVAELAAGARLPSPRRPQPASRRSHSPRT